MEFIFLIVGILCFMLGCLLVYKTYQFRKTAIRSEGVVIDFEESISKSDDGISTLMYAPIVVYYYNEQEYKFTSKVSSSSASKKVGDSIEILIDPNNPESARVNSYMLMGAGLFMSVTGLIFSSVYFIRIV